MNLIHRRRFSQFLLGATALSKSRLAMTHPRSAEERRPSLTDIPGLLVGHYTFRERPTGCTVVTSGSGFTAGVDVRGGAPGTRETDLLRSENMVEEVNAIVLSGGSAFGLDAASGVVRFLEEKGVGFEARGLRIPIVCSAILFDLGLGDPKIRPDARAGYEAVKAAGSAAVAEGSVGAGAGATVGKIFGMDRAMKAGLGSWALLRADGLRVGALVAVNAAGEVRDPANGRIVAGTRRPEGGLEDTMARLRKGGEAPAPLRDNTVIGVVATNAKLSKTQCNKVAQMAQDAIARCIYPAHAPWDGDTVFSIATGEWRPPARQEDAGLIGALAADVLATAILRAVDQAETWGPYPCARDFWRKASR